MTRRFINSYFVNRTALAIGVIMVFAMAFSTDSPGGEDPLPPSDREVNDVYVEMRRNVLNLKEDPPQEAADQLIYAAVVDMDMGKAVVTLACIADGTTSLYFSSGGGSIGLGQKDERIALATQAFLKSAEQIVDLLQIVDEYPLPEGKNHMVYLISEKPCTPASST